MGNESLTATDASGLALRVEFVWREDRFGQVISVVESDGTAISLLESVEGTANDNYPGSPPFQSVRIETLTDGRLAALLVGMAGRSHWSGSVESIAGGAGFVFDIACRVGEFGPILASQYSVVAANADNVGLVADRPNLELQIGQQRLIVAGVADPTSVYYLPASPRGVVFMPGRNTGIPAGTTVRWKYEVRLALPPDRAEMAVARHDLPPLHGAADVA